MSGQLQDPTDLPAGKKTDAHQGGWVSPRPRVDDNGEEKNMFCVISGFRRELRYSGPFFRVCVTALKSAIPRKYSYFC
jgi:hypothetical protein